MDFRRLFLSGVHAPADERLLVLDLAGGLRDVRTDLPPVFEAPANAVGYSPPPSPSRQERKSIADAAASGEKKPKFQKVGRGAPVKIKWKIK